MCSCTTSEAVIPAHAGVGYRAEQGISYTRVIPAHAGVGQRRADPSDTRYRVIPAHAGVGRSDVRLAHADM